MSWMDRAKAAFGLSGAPLRHPITAGGGLWRLLARTQFDYRREVGDCLDASVITAPVGWLQRALPEATLAIRRKDRAGNWTMLPEHPMLALIQSPNAYYGDIALWFGTVLSWCIDGNAYWLKARDGNGRVRELWYVPHWLIEPKAPIDGGEFLSHYEYRPGGAAGVLKLDPRDVVHFRAGLNPRNLLKGLAPIDGVIREIFMDLEASNFVAALLRNMGVPGVVISPKAGAMPTPDDVEATSAWFNQAFGGDRRGRPLVMGAATEVQPFGFNPQQMNMSEARDVAEERVCACLGVPAAVVGFGAGLQSTKVGATMEELRKLAWWNGVLPLARALADELKRSLLPDFGVSTGLDLYWDTDQVPALQEDENKAEQRWNERLKAGAITLYEWRQGIGLDADDSHRLYLRPNGIVEVPEGAPPRVTVPALLPKSAVKAVADAAAMARAEAWVAAEARSGPALEAKFARGVAARFIAFGREAAAAARPVLAAEPKGKAAKETIEEIVARILGLTDPAAWQDALAQEYGAHYLEIVKAVQDAAEQAGLGTMLPDAVARAVVAAGGRRAGLIDLEQQTRQAIYDALTEGRAEGEGVDQLANRIADHVEAGPWRSGDYRAKLIARTETKYAQNISTLERARAAGVQRFVIFDGRLGLPRSAPDHIARNGEIVSFEEALRLAEAEHPNGTLSFAPHFG